VEGGLLHGAAQPLRDAPGLVVPRIRQHHDELLAAVSPQEVFLPEGSAADLGHVA